MKTIITEGFCEGDLTVDGHIINHTFHIVQDNDLSLDAGGIIQKYGAVLNFKDNTLSILCTSQTMRETVIENNNSQQHLHLSTIINPQLDIESNVHNTTDPGQKKKSSKRVHLNDGLDNPTNTMCYANALFQAILKNEFNINISDNSSDTPKCNCINYVIVFMITNPHKSLNLFHKTIRQLMASSYRNEQQDTLELYHKIIQQIGSQPECCELLKKGKHFVQRCTGSLDVQIKCFSCYNTSSSIEEFNSMNIPLSSSIQESLRLVFNSEQLLDYH